MIYYDTYHFVINFVEVDFTDFVHNILVLVGDEAEAAMSVRLLVEHQHHILNLDQRICQSVYQSEGNGSSPSLSLSREGNFF